MNEGLLADFLQRKAEGHPNPAKVSLAIIRV